MAFIPLPNGISLCFDFTAVSQLFQFCLTLRKSSGPPTPTDLSVAASLGSGWWTTTLKGNISDIVTLRQVRATDMTAQGAPQAIQTVGTAGADTNVNPLPLSAALCVSGRTEKRGRSYRGRVYVSGLNRGMMSSANVMNNTYLSAFASAFTTLQASLKAANFDIVVPTRQHNGSVVSPAELNEVVAWVIDSALDSQRRRLTGRGK